jgi:YD repeat-containing protein
VANGVSTKYAESYRTYGVYNWDGQIYKYPKLEVSTDYDGQGNSFSKAVQYDYDLAARLPKQTENFGEVKWDITTGSFLDVGEDYVMTKNIYNTKRPQKLLAEESSDINGKFLDKKLYFYDELPFGYVEKGLLSEERNYSTSNSYVKSTYTYNSNGLVATKTEPGGAVTSYSYDSSYNPITVTNALNQTTTSVYNKVLGMATSATGPNGKVVQTVYDGFGNIKSVSATSPADGIVKLSATKNISYTGNGMIETENIFSGGSVYKTSVKTYDSFGRLVKSQNNSTDNSSQTIDVTYNNLGQLAVVSYPYDSNGILAGYFGGNNTTYTYDSLGRNISVIQGDLVNYTDYILNGKITRDNSTDQHKKEYKMNSLGKLSSVTEYSGANPQTTKYEWNLLGNLTKLTDAAGNIRNFFYDSEGRLLKQEDLHAVGDNTFGT